MADTTSFLGLILPGLGEYVDSWHIPNNANFADLDAWAEQIQNEIVAARFGESSLSAFLAVAHENDGTLKPTDEMIAARSSTVYGDKNQLTDVGYELNERLEEGDVDVGDAREGESSLRAALAARQILVPNMVFSGSADANGFPTWLAFAAANALVDGSSSEIGILIDGYRSRVRVLETVPLAGVAGTYFLYAQFQAGGVLRVNGDPGNAGPPTPPGVATGTTSDDTDLVARIFTDATKDFTSLDVQPGDFLEIVAPSNDAGVYRIKDVAPGGNNDQLRIWGKFPVGGLSSQAYTIHDPLAVTLAFDTAETPAAGKHYIGEADFDGAAITEVRPRHFKDTFVGDWRAFDVSGGIQEEVWLHRLGSLDLDIIVQASQANDGTAPVETLSLATVADSLGFTGAIGSLAVTDPGVNYTPPTLTAGDQTFSDDGSVDHGPLGLSGTPGGSITGTVAPNRSVRYKFTRNQINVKNAISNVFYRDFDDNDLTTGFIRVIIRKRG